MTFKPTMLPRSVPIVLVLGASPATAFDTRKLGRGGTLPLADIVALIAQPALKRDVKQALAQSKMKQDDVVCDGMRFSSQLTHLPGVRHTTATSAASGCKFKPSFKLRTAKAGRSKRSRQRQ